MGTSVLLYEPYEVRFTPESEHQGLGRNVCYVPLADIGPSHSITASARARRPFIPQ